MVSNDYFQRRRGPIARFFRAVWTFPFRLLASIADLIWYYTDWLSNKGFRRILHGFFEFHLPVWTNAVQAAVAPPKANVKTAHLLNPLYWFTWSSRFLWNWMLSRPYTSIGPAIPAVALVVTLGVLLFEVQFQEKASKLAKYREVFSVASGKKDYETATVALGRLTDLTPEDLSLRYQRALLEEDQGHHEEAQTQMLRLAVGKRFGQAALWIASKQLDFKNMGTWTAEDHQKFRAWTEIALQDNSTKSQIPAKSLMASYLYGTGAYSESVPYFEAVVPYSPDMAFAVAVICRDLGDLRRSAIYAGKAETYYAGLLKDAPLNVQHRLNLAKALILQNREEETVTLLLDGFSLTSSEALKTAAAECLTVHADRLWRSSNNTPEILMQRLQLSRRAMTLDPSSATVMDSIVNLLFQIRDNRNNEVLALRSALVQGLDEDSVHFIRGTVALLNNDFAQAKVHLEIASQKNPNMPGILNNLAVAMSQSKEPELESALKLVNAALATMPDQPYFKDTRGQILLKMGKYKEAIPDLEDALQAREIAGLAHDGLAAAYEALGEKEIAADHRRLASAAKPAQATPSTPANQPPAANTAQPNQAASQGGTVSPVAVSPGQ